MVRQGLKGYINQEDNDLLVCGEAEDAWHALESIKELDPDLVIVDISLKDRSGMDLIKDIKVMYPAVLILVLSMHDELLYAERALRAGAKGYLMKQEATEKVITAIRKIVNGDLYVSDKVAARMVRELVSGGPEVTNVSPLSRLSDRELDVFNMIGRGFSTRQIAEKLFLSVKTIDTYRSHIKEKLNLANATELLHHAIQTVNNLDNNNNNDGDPDNGE